MFGNRKKKISVIGAGNAGCISALHYYYYGSKQNFEVTLYHDPDIPMERVGQGTSVPPGGLIFNALGLTWNYNPIGATFKTGIMYEGWGKNKGNHFHEIDMNAMAMHFIPQKLSQLVLESGIVKVVEKNIKDPEKELDSDFIIDCRGRNNKNEDDYDTLINPLNAVLLCNKPGVDPDLTYTRTVATPNGWTFVIPNMDSVSYGYLYNNTITSKEEATKDFIERFDIPEIDGELTYKNYMAKNVFVGERTLLNGNRLGFLEPMEATALGFYQSACRYYFDYIMGTLDKHAVNVSLRREMKRIATFILWHYQCGSKYDTPFWKYAKSLPFKPDTEFQYILRKSRSVSGMESRYMTEHHHTLRRQKDNHSEYSQWTIRSIKDWDEHVKWN